MMEPINCSVPLTLIFSVAIACPGIASDSIEPTGAQGPSNRAPSAYQQLLEADKLVDNKSGNATIAQDPSTATTEDNGRRLNLKGKQSSRRNGSRPAADRGAAMLSDWAEGSGATAAAALAFVVGLFMLLAWAMKRGMPSGNQVVPAEAVRMLGRVPLGARQFGQLLQIGNKLVLVSVNQSGVDTLVEIDDPQEVARLVTLCSKTSGTGSQKEFEEIFGQFANEKSESGFLGSEASLFSSSDNSYDSSAGGRRYA